jgi:hypothetical protein
LLLGVEDLLEQQSDDVRLAERGDGVQHRLALVLLARARVQRLQGHDLLSALMVTHRVDRPEPQFEPQQRAQLVH